MVATDNLIDFLKALSRTFAESESLISKSSGFEEQTILIPADGLTTTVFNPLPQIVDAACLTATIQAFSGK